MIRDMKKFEEALVNWDFLARCFGPTRIRVSDVDGFVERNWHVLFLEAKGMGVPVPRGQALAFNTLSRMPKVTVLVLWGRNVEGGAFLVSHMQEWGTPQRDATNDDVIGFVGSWFAEVDREAAA